MERTMKRKRSCFLISPIGDEGSDIRKNANDLFELIVVPALQLFDFEVIRADKIPRPSVITTDIIQLVQTSDLCIMDLTGSNPNVFYECGRRHETAKPFIQLIRKGEKLPFDVSGIRTIEYDLSNARTTHESIVTIQTFVKEMLSTGFDPSSTGESLSSIASSLERIERKLNQVVGIRQYNPPKELTGIERMKFQLNPESALSRAIEEGNLDLARTALLSMSERKSNPNILLSCSAFFAEMGDDVAMEILDKLLKSKNANFDTDTLKSYTRTIIDAYYKRNKEKELYDIIEPILSIPAEDSKTSDEDKAYFLNQLQLVLYYAKNYERALPIANRIVKLSPEEGVYWYNLSLIYHNLNMPDECLNIVDKYMSKENLSKTSYMLSHAVERYFTAKRYEEAKRAYKMLEEKDANRAKELLNEFNRLKDLIESK